MAFKWFGDQWDRMQADALRGRLDHCGMILSRHAQENLGKVGRAAPPGEFPFKKTGTLRNSIAWEVAADGKSATWGTNIKYGRWLEIGTNVMSPRPWMMPTNLAKQKEVNRILGKKIT